MKLFRKLLRYWMAVASVLSFLGGWVILAHSPKPVPPVTTSMVSLPALPPIQAYGTNVNGNGLNFFNAPANTQSAQPVQPVQQSFPVLRTRGS